MIEQTLLNKKEQWIKCNKSSNIISQREQKQKMEMHHEGEIVPNNNLLHYKIITWKI